MYFCHNDSCTKKIQYGVFFLTRVGRSNQGEFKGEEGFYCKKMDAPRARERWRINMQRESESAVQNCPKLSNTTRKLSILFSSPHHGLIHLLTLLQTYWEQNLGTGTGLSRSGKVCATRESFIT